MTDRPRHPDGSWAPHVEWPPIEELTRRRSQGATLQVLADELGVSREAVRQHMAKRAAKSGIPLRKVRRRHNSKAEVLVRQMAKRGEFPSDLRRRHPDISRSLIGYWMRKIGYRPGHKPVHGRSRYNQGCRCEICMQANRHQMHVWYRSHNGTRRVKHWRSDRLPCADCEAEGFTQPVKTKQRECVYCGDTHIVQVMR